MVAIRSTKTSERFETGIYFLQILQIVLQIHVVRKFPGKVSRISGNCAVSFRKANHSTKSFGNSGGTVIPGKNFPKISVYFVKLLSFPEIPEMLFHSPQEIFGNSNWYL